MRFISVRVVCRDLTTASLPTGWSGRRRSQGDPVKCSHRLVMLNVPTEIKDFTIINI